MNPTQNTEYQSFDEYLQTSLGRLLLLVFGNCKTKLW